MRVLRRTILGCVLVLVSGLVGATPAGAAPPDCSTITGSGTGSATPTGTIATITGAGVLDGTTVGVFDAPAGEFTGTVTFTTVDGDTLAVPVEGFLDVTTLRFRAAGDIGSGTGTGELAGATGFLLFRGKVTDPATGAFTETLVGRICLA